jgi:6-phosphogluconolactonase
MTTSRSADADARLVIGTYTEELPHVLGRASGIGIALAENGVLGPLAESAYLKNPSWLGTDSTGRRMYAVSETAEFEGQPTGGVASFEFDGKGVPVLLNVVSSGGREPAHLAVDPSGRYLVVANYGSGSVAVFELGASGDVGERIQLVQHTGGTAGSARQEAPHPHQVIFDPVTGDAMVTDLGLDAVFVYELGSDGHLTERASARIRLESGAGARHIAFHPSGRYLFVVGELTSTLATYVRSGSQFSRTDLTSTLPEGFRGHNQAAAVRVSASGRFVFASNRGHDSVAMFRFDESAGALALVHVVPSAGKTPRDMVQSPVGEHLLVANQDSDTIVTFAIDEEAATLTKVSEARALTPVCLLFSSVSSGLPEIQG